MYLKCVLSTSILDHIKRAYKDIDNHAPVRPRKKIP